MESDIPVEGAPITAIDRDLGSLSDRLRGAVRRSYWFSVLAWAFGIAVAVGTLVPYQTTKVTAGGSTSTSGPAWTAPVFFLSLTVILVFAVLALLVARREALAGEVPRSSTPTATQSEGGWVAAVQHAQKIVSRMKHVTEFSFVPLILGTLVMGVWGVSALLTGTRLEPWGLALGVVPVALLAGALYLISRGWIGSYQTLLDRQVGELSHLEAEFLWRFTGAPA